MPIQGVVRSSETLNKNLQKNTFLGSYGSSNGLPDRTTFLDVFKTVYTGCGPDVFTGHTSGIRHVLFFRNDTHMVSCADDKTLRVWSRQTGKEVQKIDFPSVPNSLEVSRDGSVLTVAYANNVAFFDSQTLEKIREFSVPSPVNSASLHPNKSIFVAGGEDLKVYKFDYTTGTEIESFKGHFGSLHCVKFSPDGELYASGSEDGTLRLWQTTVGKTYGLWKCVEGNQMNMEALSPPKEVSA